MNFSIFGLVFVNPSFAISIFVSPLMNKNSSSFAVGSLMSGFLSQRAVALSTLLDGWEGQQQLVMY